MDYKRKEIEVPVDSIVPSPAQTRKKSGFTKDSIAQLAESIRQNGLLYPPLVRQVNSHYELISGERRWRASKTISGTIKVIMIDIDEKTAHEMTVIENLEREDLLPIEEAEGVSILLAEGKTVQEIADKLARPVGWVARRARIANLTPEWKKAINTPEHDYSDLSASHLEYVARFDKNIQNEMFKAFLYGSISKISAKDFKEKTDKFLLKLSTAQWSLADDTLVPKTPSCEKCKKRTSQNPTLFDDFVDQKTDMCLDKQCFQLKMQATILRKKEELESKHDNVIMAKEDYFPTTLPQDSPLLKDVEIYRSYDWQKSNKNDPKAVPVLIVDTGKVHYVKKVGRGNQPYNSGPSPLKERRAKLEKRRNVHILTKIIEIIDAERDSPDRLLKCSTSQLSCAIAEFGSKFQDKDESKNGAFRYFSGDEPWARYHTVYGHVNQIKDDAERHEGIRGILIRAAKGLLDNWRATLYGERNSNVPDTKTGKEICSFLGVNFAGIKSDAAEIIPEPKAWANLNENGTPKKKSKKEKPESGEKKSAPGKKSKKAKSGEKAE